MKPRSIWVLFGGSSSEREVSLRSGRGILEALKSKGFAADGFDVSAGESLKKLDWSHPPDLIYPALHGGFGEDGTLQGFLESLGIPYVGSRVTASALCMHKGLAKRQASAFGVPCPHSFDLAGEQALLSFLAKPPSEFYRKKWFIKAARQGSTIGVERFDPSRTSRPEEEFKALAVKAATFDSYILIEEWIEGPELTVTVWNGKALPVVEIRPLSQFYDYESKYTKGKTEYLCPAPITPEQTRTVQRYAEDAFRFLECEDYARADFMLGLKGTLFTEINTLPGMTETSLVPKAAAAAGLSYADFVEQVVLQSFQRRRAKTS